MTKEKMLTKKQVLRWLELLYMIEDGDNRELLQLNQKIMEEAHNVHNSEMLKERG